MGQGGNFTPPWSFLISTIFIAYGKRLCWREGSDNVHFRQVLSMGPHFTFPIAQGYYYFLMEKLQPWRTEGFPPFLPRVLQVTRDRARVQPQVQTHLARHLIPSINGIPG